MTSPGLLTQVDDVILHIFRRAVNGHSLNYASVFSQPSGLPHNNIVVSDRNITDIILRYIGGPWLHKE